MIGRLKFYGWGIENTGLDDIERDRLFRFLGDRLGVQPRLMAPPQLADIGLHKPRVAPPSTIARLLTADPYERLLHTYGKSYPETVRAYSRDFANAPDLVAVTKAANENGISVALVEQPYRVAGRKSQAPAPQLDAAWIAVLEQLQQDYSALKKEWSGDTSYDNWFARPVNNAQLNSVAAYYDLVPGFERLLERNGGDLEKFYAAAERLARGPKDKRLENLRAGRKS